MLEPCSRRLNYEIVSHRYVPERDFLFIYLPLLHRQELVEQLQEAREEKKRLRKSLKEFEDQFFRQNGR